MAKLDPTQVPFDMDSIIDIVSELAGRNIRNRPALWPTYNRLWMAILESVSANGLSPILFTPMHPDELPKPQWCEKLHWIRLECPNHNLRERLFERGWDDQQVNDACDDARHLKESVDVCVDTFNQSADEAAMEIQAIIRNLSA